MKLAVNNWCFLQSLEGEDPQEEMLLLHSVGQLPLANAWILFCDGFKVSICKHPSLEDVPCKHATSNGTLSS